MKIEDSPTQVIPSVTADEIKNSINNKDNLDTKNKSSPKNKKRKFIIGSAVVVALVAALLFTFGVLYLADFFKVEDVKVPNFEGWNIQDAEKEAEKIGLRLNATLVNDDTVPKDEIIKQDISEGMMVRKNTIVKVTVSKGSKLAVVPNLVYENVMDAEGLLIKEGLIPGTVVEESSELPMGTIIRQDPIAGTKSIIRY